MLQLSQDFQIHIKSVRKNSIAKKEGKAIMNVLGIKKLYTGNFETLK